MVVIMMVAMIMIAMVVIVIVGHAALRALSSGSSQCS
jgi:hypothetical protein